MGEFLNRWNTTVPPEKVKAYRAYLKKYNKGTGYDDAEDYDIKGAFMAGEHPGPDGHMTDRFKKPNHPTFSKESQYHGKQYQGGRWNEAEHTFEPGASNLKYHPDLSEYFKRVEEPHGWKLSQKWRKINATK